MKSFMDLVTHPGPQRFLQRNVTFAPLLPEQSAADARNGQAHRSLGGLGDL
jgi:hypothetical protein